MGRFGYPRVRAWTGARERLGLQGSAPAPATGRSAAPPPSTDATLRHPGAAAVPERPSLTVLRSVDHLPQDQGGWSSARSEFKATVGALPLAYIRPSDVTAARENLVAEAQHHTDIIDLILGDVARSANGTVDWRPTLFVDEPGSGKSRLARRLAEALHVPLTVYGAGGVSDGSFGGTSRQWSSGRASVPLQAIRNSGCASPCIVVDEIDKAGTDHRNGSLLDALVAFLEPETACRYHDPYVETAVDLGRVLWLATANGTSRIPGPLLDRFWIVRLRRPREEHVPAVARSILADLRRVRGESSMMLPDLAPDELEIVVRGWRRGGGSVRLLRRLVDTVVDGRTALASRH